MSDLHTPMPDQISIGPFGIDSYTFCAGMGAILGIAWILAARLRNSAQDAPGAVSATLNGLLLVGIGSSVAGRLAYALIYLDYFRDHLAEIASAASPGYSGQAAILGGMAGWWLARRLRLPVADPGLVVLATLIGIGASLGCVPHGCAYGQEVFWGGTSWIEQLAWLLRVDWPDAYRISNPRLPIQLFLAGWLALCGVIALVPARRRQPLSPVSPTRGIRLSPVALWLVLFAMGDFALQFARADPMPVVAGLRAAQWLDIVLWLAGCTGLARNLRLAITST
jgi:prolipoprotein diacylglyceryltransferase